MGWKENVAYCLVGSRAASRAGADGPDASSGRRPADRKDLHLRVATRTRVGASSVSFGSTGPGRLDALRAEAALSMTAVEGPLPRLTRWRRRLTCATGSRSSSARASSSASTPRSTRPRGTRDHRPDGQGRRAGAALRRTEGLAAPAADQPVRHRAAHVPRPRRRPRSTTSREARGRARDAAAPGPREKVRGLKKLKSIADSRPKTVRSGPARRSCSTATTSTSTCCRSSAAGRATRRRSSRSRP